MHEKDRASMPTTVRCFLTARDGDARLAEQPPLPSLHGEHDLPRVMVDASRTFQTIEGFGGAFTEAAAVTWQKLDPPQREAMLRDCFDPQHGHGYTLCRVHINSCDFSLGNYSHVERPGDTELHSFSIERDRQALLPFIKAAQAVKDWVSGQTLKRTAA